MIKLIQEKKQKRRKEKPGKYKTQYDISNSNMFQ